MSKVPHFRLVGKLSAVVARLREMALGPKADLAHA